MGCAKARAARKSLDIWSRFQRKVVLCYTGYMDRYESIKGELSRVGMRGVEYSIDFPSPLKGILKDGIRTTEFTGRPGPFACGIAHYSAIKQTYEMGCESLLLMEDDIRFLNSLELIHRIVNALPSDYDYAQFERAKPYEMPMAEWLNLKNGKHANEYWLPFTNLRGGGCYAMSRSGMKHMIDELERVFVSRKVERLLTNDYYVKTGSHLKRYFCYPNVAVQTQTAKSNSDIIEYWRRNEMDGIRFLDYNTAGTIPPILGKDDFVKKVDEALSRPVQTGTPRPMKRLYDGWGIKPLLPIAFPSSEHTTEGEVDAAVLWGYNTSDRNVKALAAAMRDNARILMCEPGFISSGTTWADKGSPAKYRIEHSLMVDRRGQFFDGTRRTDIEAMLDDRSLIPTAPQLRSARKLIDKIVGNKVSKYNHQPIFIPDIGRKGVRKVLVVDQSYGDFSISRGCASEQTFIDMLDAAIYENQDADVIVKTHPDTIAGARKAKAGYYSDLVPHGNVYKVKYPINPFSLMEVCDKVYVCSSQFGLEALMAGKEVHVFGMPFYAGWGLTVDAKRCPRRTNTRSLEELVFIFYRLYTTWVMPEENRICSVDAVIDKVLQYRKEILGDGKPPSCDASCVKTDPEASHCSVVCHPDKSEDGW